MPSEDVVANQADGIASLFSPGGVLIKENTANGNVRGIIAFQDTGTIISDNTANGNRFGMVDFFTTGSVITDIFLNGSGFAGPWMPLKN